MNGATALFLIMLYNKIRITTKLLKRIVSNIHEAISLVDADIIADKSIPDSPKKIQSVTKI